MPNLIDHKMIRDDLGTQTRVATNEGIVKEYTEDMERGDKFPPVVVFYDEKKDYYILGDGFHRLAAHRLARPNEQIMAEIFPGDLEYAKWCALSANKNNSLRRTNADKRNAVKKALLHRKGTNLSSRAIANWVGVDHVFVEKIRRELIGVTGDGHQSTLRTGQDGRTIETAKIGGGQGKRTITADGEKPAPTIDNYRAETIKWVGKERVLVKNPPPFGAQCNNCRFLEIHEDDNGKRVGIGWCEIHSEQFNHDDEACEEWEIYVPDPPLVEESSPPEIIDLDNGYKFREPPSIRGPVGPYEKTRGSVRILFHLHNPELAACELRNTCDYQYMTSVWAAYKRLINDNEC